MTEETFQFTLVVSIGLLIVSNLLLAYSVWRQGEKSDRRASDYQAIIAPPTETPIEENLKQQALQLAYLIEKKNPSNDLEMLYLGEAALYGAILEIEEKYASVKDWRRLKELYEDWCLEVLGVVVELPDKAAKAMFKTIKETPGVLRKKVFRTVNQVGIKAGAAAAGLPIG